MNVEKQLLISVKNVTELRDIGKISEEVKMSIK